MSYTFCIDAFACAIYTFCIDARSLKQARLSAGLSQETLGKILGVHQVTIMRWERGMTPIKRIYADEIRRILGVEIDPRAVDERAI